jgi:hypothetical protein
MPHKTKKPSTPKGADSLQNNFFTPINYTKKPPYFNSLNLKAKNCLVICTGTGAWERAKSSTWFAGCKVVLPFGDDPAAYAWSVAAGHDVLIAGFGDLEPIAIIAKLAALLLAVGAGLVIYAPDHGAVIRIDARRTAA